MPDIIHYVKFQRGTIDAYDRLKEANRLDGDTLYFVYTDISAEKGLLYLGEKLISGSVNEQGIVIDNFSIGDLGDVVLEGEDGEPLANKQILVYNNGEWVNASLSTIIDTAIGEMEGATAVADGQSGLVPAPVRGDQDKFLRGDGTWAAVPRVTFHSGSFEETASGSYAIKGLLEANPGYIASVNEDGEIIWIPQPAHLSRTKVNSLNDIDVTSLEAVNKIFMVRKAATDDAEDDHYEEYMVLDGALEKIGSFGADLDNYATKTYVRNQVQIVSDEIFDLKNGQNEVIRKGLKSRVSDIEGMLVNYSAIGDLDSIVARNTTIVDELTNINNQINAINDRITWENIPAVS